MRKILSITAAVLLSGVAAYAMNIPLVPGPIDVTNAPGIINGIIQSLNANGPGLVGAQPGPTSSIATTVEQILASTVIPTGTLTQPGQSLRIKCAGTTAANVHTKGVGLYFGSTVVSSAAFTSGAAGVPWQLDLMVTQATLIPTANTTYIGQSAVATPSTAGLLTLASGNDTTDNLTTGVTVKCDAIQGTASAADVVLEDLVIEQVK